MKHTLLLSMAICLLTMVACTDNDPQPTDEKVPSMYSFERNGFSTVFYPGQTERLNQVAELKASLLTDGDNGIAVSGQALLDAYQNTNGNGNGLFSFTSTKRLDNKVFGPDGDSELFESLFTEMASASIDAANGAQASNGQAGLIIRENSGKSILLSSTGMEFTQLVEKGLMGAVFYHQIYNEYLSDARVGDGVENDVVLEGENYTLMEHHWDEAFGYWSAPLDFTSPWPSDRSGETRFWSRYSNTVDNVLDGQLGTNKDIMNAFKAGRNAIVNKDYDERDVQREVLYEKLDLVAAGTSIHYINSTLKHLNEGKTGEAFHTLSEAWAFVNALRYNPFKSMTLEEIDQVMNEDLGPNGNFWDVTIDGLNQAKETIVNSYPQLESVKDQL